VCEKNWAKEGVTGGEDRSVDAVVGVGNSITANRTVVLLFNCSTGRLLLNCSYCSPNEVVEKSKGNKTPRMCERRTCKGHCVIVDSPMV
jgi:hypothetical protein